MSETTVGRTAGAVDYGAEQSASLRSSLHNLLPEKLDATCPGCHSSWKVGLRDDMRKLNPRDWNRIIALSDHFEEQRNKERRQHAAKVEGLEGEIEAKKKVAEAKDAEILQVRRQAARLEQDVRELKNKRDRLTGEMDAKTEAARDDIVKAMLPVTDAIDDAVKHAEAQEEADSGYVDGIRMLRRSIDAVLKTAGYEAQEVIGKKFDSQDHESVSSVESADHFHDEIVEEVQRGYVNTKSGEIVRHAKVSIAIAPSGAQQEVDEHAEGDAGDEPTEVDDDAADDSSDDVDNAGAESPEAEEASEHEDDSAEDDNNNADGKSA